MLVVLRSSGQAEERMRKTEKEFEKKDFLVESLVDKLTKTFMITMSKLQKLL